MGFSALEANACRHLVELALEEDVGPGDVTTESLVAANKRGQARYVVRTAGVVCGLPAAAMVFERLDTNVAFTPLKADGDRVEAGDTIARVDGPLRSILTGERISLNFLQRLSGVASLTRRFVDAVGDLPCKILDTRKTLPGWRLLEKYAVRAGGGQNHRLGLYDAVLIKDNHLAILEKTGNVIWNAVAQVRKRLSRPLPVEVEVDSLAQLEAALVAKPERILLDNMSVDEIRQAVERRNQIAPEVLLEASGGIAIESVRALAETGVDWISVGALTHSAPALDIGLDDIRETH
ncbi:MAG: nicotinate-nucleotide diphosphorylase (carboxylating) [Gemmatales bacterium]|nr:MAG: nicotinate-nucleotide diphosphorylase (carboxylating) [Gemmatales bacterium]